MNGKYRRALELALLTACIGLLCCVGVFFLLWGKTPLTRLLPAVVFLAALPAGVLFSAVKKHLTTRK